MKFQQIFASKHSFKIATYIYAGHVIQSLKSTSNTVNALVLTVQNAFCLNDSKRIITLQSSTGFSHIRNGLMLDFKLLTIVGSRLLCLYKIKSDNLKS